MTRENERGGRKAERRATGSRLYSRGNSTRYFRCLFLDISPCYRLRLTSPFPDLDDIAICRAAPPTPRHRLRHLRNHPIEGAEIADTDVTLESLPVSTNRSGNMFTRDDCKRERRRDTPFSSQPIAISFCDIYIAGRVVSYRQLGFRQFSGDGARSRTCVVANELNWVNSVWKCARPSFGLFDRPIDSRATLIDRSPRT